MSTHANKITSLATTVGTQNEMIRKYQASKEDLRRVILEISTRVGAGTSNYNANRLDIEMAECTFPRPNELPKKTEDVLVRSLANLCNVLLRNNETIRAEYSTIIAALDDEGGLADFDVILKKAQEDNMVSSFRPKSPEDFAPSRPDTPPVTPLPSRPAASTPTPTVQPVRPAPTPTSAAKKGHPASQEAAKTPRTETLNEAFRKAKQSVTGSN